MNYNYTLLDACIKHGMKNNRLTRLAVNLVHDAWDSKTVQLIDTEKHTTIIGRPSLDVKHHHLIWSKIYIQTTDKTKPCGVQLVAELKKRLLDRGWFRDGLRRAILLNLIN